MAEGTSAYSSQGWIKVLERHGAPTGPLVGKLFGVKDLFQVEGHANACGNPTWLQTHGPASATAPAVRALLDAGATLKGMTHMDELAYSLNGENVHYGTPVNRAAPDRVPGGSSSGSAVVVAWEEVDFALGTDTAGSVRVPASYNGIYGFRPTHGRIPLQDATPLAPSFDTCGWFARDAATLRDVGLALLRAAPAADGPVPERLGAWRVAQDVFATVPDVAEAIFGAVSPRLEAVAAVIGAPQQVDVLKAGDPQLGDLTSWLTTFRTLQSSEVAAAHAAWIQQARPQFAPDIQQRFEAAAKVTQDDVSRALLHQRAVIEHVAGIIGADAVLALPTAPGPAPRKNSDALELEEFRKKLFALTCIAGLCGLPQVSIPVASIDGLPIGLSLIGPRNGDEALLKLAMDLEVALS